MTDLEKGTILFSLVTVCLFAAVAVSLWSGKTMGIAFRGRLIARRQEEPGLYWTSLVILTAFGLVGAAVVFSNLHLQHVV